MHKHGIFPRARQDGLVIEDLGEELLLYDRERHIANCLSPIAVRIWQHCNGERDITQLAQLARADESTVVAALSEMREKDLLDGEPALMQSAISGESRREAIVRVARYGAAAAGASMIVSATASTPAMAASKGGCFESHGSKHSCCGCNDGTCINNTGETNVKQCVKECEKNGGFAAWDLEGACI